MSADVLKSGMVAIIIKMTHGNFLKDDFSWSDSIIKFKSHTKVLYFDIEHIFIHIPVTIIETMLVIMALSYIREYLWVDMDKDEL